MSTHNTRYIPDMTGASNHSNYEAYTSSDQMHNMDSNYADSLPLDQTAGVDFSDVYSYPHFQAPTQPSSQASFLVDSNNNVCMGVNPAHYGYVEQNGNPVNDTVPPINYTLRNYNPPSIHYPLPQALNQTPANTTLSNNAGMMRNATNYGCVIIIMKADINLEKLLSIIQ